MKNYAINNVKWGEKWNEGDLQHYIYVKELFLPLPL